VNREHSLLEIPSVFVGNGLRFCKRRALSSDGRPEAGDGSLSLHHASGFALAANVCRRHMHLTNLAAERSSASWRRRTTEPRVAGRQKLPAATEKRNERENLSLPCASCSCPVRWLISMLISQSKHGGGGTAQLNWEPHVGSEDQV
jgi:hypothetical protein